MRTDFGWRSRGQFLAQVQHRHPVADIEDEVGVVLHQQHTGSFPADRHDQLAEMPDFLGRQAWRWLIQQQE